MEKVGKQRRIVSMEADSFRSSRRQVKSTLGRLSGIRYSRLGSGGPQAVEKLMNFSGIPVDPRCDVPRIQLHRHPSPLLIFTKLVLGLIGGCTGASVFISCSVTLKFYS
jgi:hypothetical protein